MNFLKYSGLVALSVSLSFANANAQERAAGAGASAGTIGGIATGTIVAGAVTAGVQAAVVSNNRQSTLITPPEQEQAQPGAIKIASVTGKVTLLNPLTGETFEASADQEFAAPMTVVTDSDATILLVLSNGSSVEVQPGSRIELGTFTQQPYDPALGSFFGLAADPSISQTNIKVVSGQVAVDVKPLNGLSSFRVETPTGSTSLRNGVAFISYDASNFDTNIANVSADAVYQNPQGAATVVPAGQTLNVSAQTNPATGTLVVNSPSLSPNSSEVQSKGEALQQTVANQQQGGSQPTTPQTGDSTTTTPVTDLPDLINPTSTEPAPSI